MGVNEHRSSAPPGVFRTALLATCAALLATPVWAVSVANFTLTDHRGTVHELRAHDDVKAVVIMIQGNGCPIVRNALIDLRAVRERFQGDPVRFLMLNSNLQDDAESIRDEAQEWDIDLPILVDDTQEVGESLELTRTAEMLVIDARSWRIAYRGPINDRLVYERQRATADHHYVVDAVQAVLAGERPAVESVDAIGCLINFSGRSEPDPAETHHH